MRPKSQPAFIIVLGNGQTCNPLRKWGDWPRGTRVTETDPLIGHFALSTTDSRELTDPDQATNGVTTEARDSLEIRERVVKQPAEPPSTSACAERAESLPAASGSC